MHAAVSEYDKGKAKEAVPKHGHGQVRNRNTPGFLPLLFSQIIGLSSCHDSQRRRVIDLSDRFSE